MSTQHQEIFRRLKRRLGGRCSDQLSSCPVFIAIEIEKEQSREYAWNCKLCDEHFLWLAGPEVNMHKCPCFAVPYELLALRIDEIIKEDI